MYLQQQTVLPTGILRGLALIALMAGIALPASVAAQTPLQRVLSVFLSNGAYFWSGPSGRTALGDVSFYGETNFFGRPKRLGSGIQVSGGFQIISASDHFYPFSGGNQHNLLGPSFQVTTKRVLGRLRPYFSAGLFYGNVRSDRLNIDATDFTPSLSFGVDWPLARYFTLNVGYRFTEQIAGVGLDGPLLTLRIF